MVLFTPQITAIEPKDPKRRPKTTLFSNYNIESEQRYATFSNAIFILRLHYLKL